MNTEDPDSLQEVSPQTGRAPARPGVLRTEVWLTLHTRQAQLLIQGRPAARNKPTIIGLLGFADRLRLIWDGARADDPWADWWLIKVCDALEATRQLIGKWRRDMDNLLALQVAGMQVSLAESTRPHRTRLAFANPYAYQGAQLLSEYDALVCRALTASHIGRLDNITRHELLIGCARRLRATFMIPQGYRYTGVDRQALQEGNGRIRTACWTMGEVPEAILSGKHQAPQVPRKSRAQARPVLN